MRFFLLGFTLISATAGCSALSGLEDFSIGEASDGGSAASTGGGGATSASGGDDNNSSGGSMGGFRGQSGVGGAGGAPEPMCGNGIIEQGEQCDAGSQTMFCNQDCEVTGCGGQHDHLDPTTGHCYRYSDTDGQFGSWSDAQTFCASWQGELLVLNDDAERTFIVSLLGTLTYGNEYLWVGARDQDADGDYTWVDGSALPSSAAWWESTPVANGCVAIVPELGALVASANCAGNDLNTFHLHFACERAPEGN